MTSIADRFDQALTDQGGPPEVELLPVRLARAAVAVLPVAGAGLSAMAHPDLRLPIGSSDDVAAFADRLQFTRGVGPCLLAYRAGRPRLYTAVAQRATAPPRRPPHTDHLARRALVWKAMGLLNVQLRVTAPDALSL